MNQNHSPKTRQRIADIVLGLRVDRAVSTHLAATTPYFTISVGAVLMTGLVGTCVTESGANLCSWATAPTAGTAATLCADLDINPVVIGDMMTITGLAANAMTYNASATGLAMSVGIGVVVPIGTLDFIAAAAEGSSIWSMFYVPLEVGATVVVA